MGSYSIQSCTHGLWLSVWPTCDCKKHTDRTGRKQCGLKPTREALPECGTRFNKGLPHWGRSGKKQQSKVESQSFYTWDRQKVLGWLDHGHHPTLSERNLSKGSRTQRALDSSHSWVRRHILGTQIWREIKSRKEPKLLPLRPCIAHPMSFPSSQLPSFPWRNYRLLYKQLLINWQVASAHSFAEFLRVILQLLECLPKN